MYGKRKSVEKNKEVVENDKVMKKIKQSYTYKQTSKFNPIRTQKPKFTMT